jgi:hypothetical protein
VPVLPSEQGTEGTRGHIPAILSHPHSNGPLTPLAGSNALQRSTGSVLHCREARPFDGGEEISGPDGVRPSETSRFQVTPCPIWTQSCLYAMALIGGLGLQARWSSASSAGRSSFVACARLVAGLGEGASQHRSSMHWSSPCLSSSWQGRAGQGLDVRCRRYVYSSHLVYLAQASGPSCECDCGCILISVI